MAALVWAMETDARTSPLPRLRLDAPRALCYDAGVNKKPDYYKTLQVDPEAEPEVIAAAYRRLAAKYHPDVNKAPDAAARMRSLNEAYAVVGDEAKRIEYDRQRAAERTRGRSPASRTTYYSTRKTTPIVMVNPSALAFGSVAKGTCKTLTVQISITEGRTLIGDLRVSHPWIRLSTTRLFSNSTLVQVEVDTSGLREGTAYNGAITVDSVAYGTRAVPISLRVEAAPRPVLLVTPGILDFGTAVVGRAPKVLSLRISNGGPGTLSGVVKCHHKWLGVSQTTWSGNQVSIQAIADASGLKRGRMYEGEIELISNGGRAMVLARIQVVSADAQRIQLVEQEATRSPVRDLEFLRQRMVILRDLREPTAAQESERLVIGYLLDNCKGGDVAITLQRAIEGAQGWRDHTWLAEAVPLSQNLLPVLTDLFQRLQRWESNDT